MIDNPILFIFTMLFFAVSIAAIIFAVISYGKYDELKKRLDVFMSGKDADTLEDFFIDMQKNIDTLLENDIKNRENIKKLNRITKKSFQKYGFYKYDAFEEKSGRRSFAIALLDFTNTGYVMTCQNVGDATIMFIKDIDGGATNTKLGPEEEKALKIAMGQLDKYDNQ